MSFYHVQAVKLKAKNPWNQPAGTFALVNNMEIAGPRLFHGEDIKDPKQRWPFRQDDNAWMFHATKEAADKAAEKLQTYLDARERGKSKKKAKSTE